MTEIHCPRCRRLPQLAGFQTRFRRLMTALVLVAVGRHCEAQWDSTDRGLIADQFVAASQQIDVNAFPSPQSAAEQFLSDFQSAETFLRTKTNASNYQNWMAYLDASQLVDLLGQDDVFRSGRLARQVGRQAVALQLRLVGTAPGLELQVLTRLRESTQALIDATRFRDADRSAKQVGGQMRKLAEQIRKLDDAPSADDFANITRTIQLLRSTGQAPDLVNQLRDRFSSPNVRLVASERLVQAAVNQSIDQSSPVRDCILGTRIVGTAQLGGSLTADVLPSTGAAAIRVALSGTVQSRNTGYNGPVKLRTLSNGQVWASRTLFVDDSGLRGEPTVASASLSTQVLSIDHPLRIVRKIAKKRADQQKSKAERIGTRRLRERTATQFSRQTDQAGSVDFANRFARVTPILTRLDLPNPVRSWNSSDRDVSIDMTLADLDQLAAPGQMFGVITRPDVEGAYDFAIQIHETAIDNLFAPIIAGRTMTETQLGGLLGRAESPSSLAEPTTSSGSSQPKQTEQDGDESPFEIDFARVRPIVFQARDQTIRLGIRGTRFSQGTRELNQSLEISASYLPALLDDDTVILIRDGAVQVDFPSRGRRLSLSQTGLKTSIEKKFADVFPETLLGRPLRVPATAKINRFAGQTFWWSGVDARHGWLTLQARRKLRWE